MVLPGSGEPIDTPRRPRPAPLKFAATREATACSTTLAEIKEMKRNHYSLNKNTIATYKKSVAIGESPQKLQIRFPKRYHLKPKAKEKRVTQPNKN